MKIARYGAPGFEWPALIDSHGQLRDVSKHVVDIGAGTLSEKGLRKLAEIDVDLLPAVDQTNLRIGAPIAPGGKVICIGLNYIDHAAEVDLPAPKEPTIFMKGCRPTGAYDKVRFPKHPVKGGWEVELGVVIGESGLYIDYRTSPDFAS